MSRAFVKEEAGERWTPPAQAREYRIVIDGEVVRETDDLLDALSWMGKRPATGFELRSREGHLLAVA
ncbi:hypothetical protein [Deinococcus fonticola]|uniref:hypothetical protein n=1 Tax=Deinococcus fonticola TaxID=2528713 RepID=UPI001074FBF9|nr:hypothetical protein [Deinococcus fonticola]